MLLLFAMLLSITDIIIQSILKLYSLNKINYYWIFIAIFISMIVPIIYLKGLQSNNMVILNIGWDIISDILITIVGVYIFAEHISWKQYSGIFMGIISILLLQ